MQFEGKTKVEIPGSEEINSIYRLYWVERPESYGLETVSGIVASHITINDIATSGVDDTTGSGIILPR